MSPLPVKTSSFQLPNAETVETVYIRRSDGVIVPRRLSELVTRPPLPLAGNSGPLDRAARDLGYGRDVTTRTP